MLTAELNTPLSIQDSVASIAVKFPRSIPVFRKHQIDFCCGGHQRLKDACLKNGLNPELIMGEIQALADSLPVAAGIESRSMQEIIDFILERFHERHRQDLPQLIELARKVEETHHLVSLVPTGLSELLEIIREEMEEHMTKEENILFPWILFNGGARPVAPIQVMMSEHQSHGQRLEQLRELCHGFKLPPEACPTWKALYEGCQQLIADVMEHIHLENNVLFPLALGE